MTPAALFDLPLVRRCASSMTVWAVVGSILVRSAIAYHAALLVYLIRLDGVIGQYGFGNVPVAALPSPVPGVESLPLLRVIGGGIAFVVGAGSARRVVNVLGVQGLRYSSGWTLFGLFVPLVNLVRPWLGLGEVDRALRTLADPRTPPGTRVFQAGFSPLVALLAIGYASTVVGGRVLGIVADEAEAGLAKHTLEVPRYFFMADIATATLMALLAFWAVASAAFLLVQAARLRTIMARAELEVFS